MRNSLGTVSRAVGLPAALQTGGVLSAHTCTRTQARHGPRRHPWPQVPQLSGALAAALPQNAVCQALPLLPAPSPPLGRFRLGPPLGVCASELCSLVTHTCCPDGCGSSHSAPTGHKSCLSPRPAALSLPTVSSSTWKSSDPRNSSPSPKFPNPVRSLSEMMMILSRFAGA